MLCNPETQPRVRFPSTTCQGGLGEASGMENTMQQAVAARLAAIMKELGKKRREMADFLDVSESRLGNWLGSGEKANMPHEAAMVLLCDKVPFLTMDYIYRGRLDCVPYAFAIRLKARELGLDPDQPDIDLEPVAAAVGLSNRRV